MNRYKIHQPKEPKVWPKYYPGLVLKHKLKIATHLTLDHPLIGPVDGLPYWACKPSWPSHDITYAEQTLDEEYE